MAETSWGIPDWVNPWTVLAGDLGVSPGWAPVHGWEMGGTEGPSGTLLQKGWGGLINWSSIDTHCKTRLFSVEIEKTYIQGPGWMFHALQHETAHMSHYAWTLLWAVWSVGDFPPTVHAITCHLFLFLFGDLLLIIQIWMPHCHPLPNCYSST